MKRLLIGLLWLGLPIATQADVFELNAIITADQEIPAPVGVPAGAAGFGMISYDDSSNELSWDIAWQGLSGAPVGMHFHEAPAGATGGVVVDIGGLSGLASPTVGSTVVSDDFATALLGGGSYINIHTAANGPGEIRGQVSPDLVSLTASLDVAQEIPTPTGTNDNVSGTASLAYDAETNLLGWRIEWENLTGPAVGMHIHGPAGFGETAGVIVNLGDESGLISPSIGATTISAEAAEAILGGQAYINIHTAQNAPGEIRGQIVPEPTSMSLTILAVAGLMARTRRVK